jgi:hypothetical protein
MKTRWTIKDMTVGSKYDQLVGHRLDDLPTVTKATGDVTATKTGICRAPERTLTLGVGHDLGLGAGHDIGLGVGAKVVLGRRR